MFKHLVTAFLACVIFSAGSALATPLKVVVSIAPQRYLVHAIAGDLADVAILIAPGQTPATWDPSPQSMTTLAESDILFPIGVPFEEVWLPRLQQMLPKLNVADIRQGITLLPISGHHHHEGEHHGHGHDQMMDPHIWLDPLHAITLAENITRHLCALAPQHQQTFTDGLEQLRKHLLQTHEQVKQKLEHFHGRHFMVFHPSWGYFAHRYHLEQLAIEINGKEPSGIQLAQTAELARAQNVRVIFVQQQFSRKAAQAIADQIGAQVAVLDPLAEDLPKTLVMTADKISQALETPWPQPSH
ncbi:metal ABC transporter solute-binding protein, Zn/Mn family [uncultured Desulfuromonas sp.]|uniref:metal ABC transporter solute-binding protein, Zn/Mn family n=1 Tax=uncultured Desulfuromonas sp. TaxID=181013 RepID=UPI002AAB4EED|nr:zinc ABC transporter substrate-binding protein [uncultured Desulfuromonas sp.]